MNDRPKMPIMAMAATVYEENDYIYVFDRDGVLWNCRVNFDGTTWQRVPMKEDAK